MKKKVFALLAAFTLCLSSMPASASGTIVLDPEAAEEAVILSDYTTDCSALSEADHIMFSGNQVLLKMDLMVQVSGCEITASEMEWEVSGTANVTYQSDSFFKSVSYEENYANTYCLITANSPGTVHVKGQEFNLVTGLEGAEFYWNLTVGEDGNFEETVTYDEPVELNQGDCNLDGNFSVADVVMLQKWLLGAGDLTCWQNADFCADNKIDVFDLCVMKRKLLEESTIGTLDNMPIVMDYYNDVTDDEKNTLWNMLAYEYPDMDFSDFTFVYDPDHPLSSYYNGKLFSVYYKDTLLHGYGNINCDSNVFAVVGNTNAVNFMVAPSLFAEVDPTAACISEDVILRNSGYSLGSAELIIYVDAYEEIPPRLAYRAITSDGYSEYIFDAVTGDEIEWIPYYVI